MLTGKALGEAVEEAIRLKGVSKAAVARHFGIKGPSIYDWINHGRVGKQHLTALFEYFSDVVGPDHWGLNEPISSSQPTRPTAANIMSAARLAATSLIDPDPLDPADPVDAELLAIALEAVLDEGIEEVTPSDANRFAERMRARSGEDGSDRQDGRARGPTGEEEAGEAARAPSRRARKRA